MTSTIDINKQREMQATAHIISFGRLALRKDHPGLFVILEQGFYDNYTEPP